MRYSERAILAALKKQRYRCALTGRELTPEVTSVDHRIPATRGGAPGMENVWLVHEDVNRAKGTMTAEEFVSLCREVVRHHRHTQSPSPVALDNTRTIEVEPLPLFLETNHARN